MSTQIITINDIDNETIVIKNNKLTVDATKIVPASKADLFLKSVAPNATNDGIIFTTGASTDTAEDATLTLPMAGFLTGVAKESEVQDLQKTQATQASDITAIQNAIVPATLGAALLADPTFLTALKTALKGEEIQAIDGSTKGYLIATT